jgi:hypothetical protein
LPCICGGGGAAVPVTHHDVHQRTEDEEEDDDRGDEHHDEQVALEVGDIAVGGEGVLRPAQGAAPCRVHECEEECEAGEETARLHWSLASPTREPPSRSLEAMSDKP